MRPVPPWLAALPTDLDLSDERGKPTGVARLVLVLLLAHADQHMHAWPGTKRLAELAGTSPGSVRKALRLLVERHAIERVHDGKRFVWQIRLSTDEPCSRVRVFWPSDGSDSDARQTAPFRALMSAVRIRNHVAAIMMLYQFARRPDIPGSVQRPNQTWIAEVLSTSVHTIRLAKKEAIAHGLATQDENGALVFEDPARWAEILSPSEPEPAEKTSEADDPAPACANDGDYVLRDPIADIERVLARAGWALPTDPLAHQIIVAAVQAWGSSLTIDWLSAELAGPFPSYALEPLGRALGPEYECPYQLVPLRAVAEADDDQTHEHDPVASTSDEP